MLGVITISVLIIVLNSLNQKIVSNWSLGNLKKVIGGIGVLIELLWIFEEEKEIVMI